LTTRLQVAREALGLSRRALSRDAKLSPGRVGQLEAGVVRLRPFSVELKRLAMALGLPLEQAPTLLDEVNGDDSPA